jgi:hypothetical protein
MVAEQVLNMSSLPSEPNETLSISNTETVARRCSACDMKKKQIEQEKLLMSISTKPSSNTTAIQKSDDLAKEVSTARGGESSSLDSSTREFMETHFGFDFNNVRIHADDKAIKSAKSINALAYTFGNDIIFGEGQYAPLGKPYWLMN